MPRKSKGPTIEALLACRSVKAIVALMKKYRIKGQPYYVFSCPLAHYVNRATGKDDACVGIDGSSAGSLRPSRIRAEFVRAFDSHQFPDLLEKVLI